MAENIKNSNAAEAAALENKGVVLTDVDKAIADKAIADKAAADKVIADKADADKGKGKADADKGKGKKLKVKFKLSPCGKFKLPYNVDQVVSLPEAQATEIVESGYGEFVK